MHHVFGTGRDPLGRYYTDPSVGRFFVSLFDRRHASSILDLGSGNGSLSVAAAQRWASARIQSVDIDHGAAEHILQGMASAGHQEHAHLIADALDENLPEMFGNSRFDLAVCNPPYSRIRWREGFARILSESGFDDLHALPADTLPSDIVFVAQILRLAEPGAEIGVIVPDGLVSGRRSRVVRRALLSRVRIVRVVQLPRGSFRGTEAQAHVIVFRNEVGQGEPIEISLMEPSGITPPLKITYSEAEVRMDYRYYGSRNQGGGKHFTLRGLGAEIVRGTLSSSEARTSPHPIFHTTCYGQPNPLAYQLSHQYLGLDRSGYRVAEPGDILLARVDRDLHRKVCLISEGRSVLTDCIFRVRVSASWRETVARALQSASGQAALIRASRGVGARMLNKEDLLDLEVELE